MIKQTPESVNLREGRLAEDESEGTREEIREREKEWERKRRERERSGEGKGVGEEGERIFARRRDGKLGERKCEESRKWERGESWSIRRKQEM